MPDTNPMPHAEASVPAKTTPTVESRPAATDRALEVAPATAPAAEPGKIAEPVVVAKTSDTPQLMNESAPFSQASDSLGVDRAWRTFAIVNEWVRFLDGKATAILAADAAITGALLSFIKGEADTLNSHWLAIPFLLSTMCFLLASIYKGLYCIAPTLYPGKAPADTMFFFWKQPFQTNEESEKRSVTFFEHIAAQQSDDYIRESHRVFSSDALTYNEVSRQVQSNSVVATHKAADVGHAIQFLVWAILFGLLSAFFSQIAMK